MDVINSEAKRNVLRKLILVRLCFASRAAASEGQGQNGRCGKAGHVRAQPSGGRRGAARLPSTGARVSPEAPTAQGRQIQWLCSQARGCRTAGQRMKQRQEGRGCETLEKRALQGPGTKAQAHLRRSGRTRGKRQLVDAQCARQAVTVLKQRQIYFISRSVSSHTPAQKPTVSVCQKCRPCPSETLLRFSSSTWLTSSLSVNNCIALLSKICSFTPTVCLLL